MKKKYQWIFRGLASAVAVMLMFAQAHAVDFAISGHINRTAMYVDDGSTAKWFFVDNDNSSTRFRFTGDNEFDAGWKVGIVAHTSAHLEFQCFGLGLSHLLAYPVQRFLR